MKKINSKVAKFWNENDKDMLVKNFKKMRTY